MPSTNVIYKRGLKESGKPATELERGHKIDIYNDKSQILYRIVNNENKNKFDKSFVKIDNYYQYRLSSLINICIDLEESTKKRISSI